MGLLIRWILRLIEFGYGILYRDGRLYAGPNVLSQLDQLARTFKRSHTDQRINPFLTLFPPTRRGPLRALKSASPETGALVPIY